jgi:hypothetical protein
VRAVAKSGDYDARLGQQALHARVVEVVVVVVRNQHGVNLGHFLYAVDAGAVESLRHPGKRGGVAAEHRIYEEALTAQLDEVRGVAQPDHDVFVARQPGQLGSNRW